MSTASLNMLVRLMIAQVQECVFEKVTLTSAQNDFFTQLQIAQEAARVHIAAQLLFEPSKAAHISWLYLAELSGVWREEKKTSREGQAEPLSKGDLGGSTAGLELGMRHSLWGSSGMGWDYMELSLLQ